MKSTSSSRTVIPLSSEVVSADPHAAYRPLVGGSGVGVVARRRRSGGFGLPTRDGDGGDVGLAWGWRAGDAHGRARGRRVAAHAPARPRPAPCDHLLGGAGVRRAGEAVASNPVRLLVRPRRALPEPIDTTPGRDGVVSPLTNERCRFSST